MLSDRPDPHAHVLPDPTDVTCAERTPPPTGGSQERGLSGSPLGVMECAGIPRWSWLNRTFENGAFNGLRTGRVCPHTLPVAGFWACPAVCEGVGGGGA